MTVATKKGIGWTIGTATGLLMLATVSHIVPPARLDLVVYLIGALQFVQSRLPPLWGEPPMVTDTTVSALPRVIPVPAGSEVSVTSPEPPPMPRKAGL